MTSLWKITLLLGIAVGFMWLLTRGLPSGDKRNERVDISAMSAAATTQVPDSSRLETATLAGGCFWCVEAVLEQVKGIASVESGYTGGESQNPDYSEVTSGRSGHAEAVQIKFDPEILSYNDLLTVFWELHDPTTKNRQGADRGTHYRSAIFYHNAEQKRLAEESLAAKDASKQLRRGIVTEIAPLTTFYPAEGYHQNYFANNPHAGYCRAVISPKLEKLGLVK